MVETELAEIESSEDRGPVTELWGFGIGNPAPVLEWGTISGCYRG